MSLFDVMKLETMELHKLVKVSRLMKNRERLVDLENTLAVNMKGQDVTRMYDKIKHLAMTESELDEEIQRSENSLGNIGKI